MEEWSEERRLGVEENDGLLLWLMPLIPAPERMRQVASLAYIVLGQPGKCRETLAQKGKQASKHVA